MSFPKVSFEESLVKNVVGAGKCVGCGTCVVVCPYGCLELKQGTPTIVKECKNCGICAQVCPQNELVQSKAEASVFGRERRADETFGIYRRLCIARASDPKVRRISQDGGAVTALLLFALEKGIIDGAIVSGLGGIGPSIQFQSLPVRLRR